MKIIKGHSQKQQERILGIITKEKRPFYARGDYIFVTNTVDIGCAGYKGYISTKLNDRFYLPYGMSVKKKIYRY